MEYGYVMEDHPMPKSSCLLAKHPVLFPNGHPLSILVVEGCHRKVKHDGIGETLYQLNSHTVLDYMR